MGQDTNKLQILLKQAEAQRNKLTEDEFRWKKETKEMTKELERKKQLVSWVWTIMLIIISYDIIPTLVLNLDFFHTIELEKFVWIRPEKFIKAYIVCTCRLPLVLIVYPRTKYACK